ncbi:MAG: hypothetical protein AAGH17_05810 [Pseudomonadota bacterium]
MTPKLIKTLIAGVLASGVAALAIPGAPLAQSMTTEPAGAQAFSPENAIVNTAIPFGVGAREAQQALRGSFGWATFQEGLVLGSYFRFDPDGYARFSPSPRLDTDVFEVICRPRTYVCMARKGPMTLTLNSTGHIQIKLEQSTAQDQFFLNDGFSELQVPPRVLGTLDQQLEALLSSGGTLVTRRNGNVLEEVPLTGFPVVAAYLKWVTARQDYTVLPADWPVPRSGGPNPDTLTQPVNWTGAGRPVAVPVATDPALIPPNGLAATGGSSAAGTGTQSGETLAALQAEVAFLRDMLIAQTGAGVQPATSHSAVTMPGFGTQQPQVTSWTREPSLQADLAALEQDLSIARPATQHDRSDAGHSMATLPDDFGEEAKHLHYLTVRMGLDAKTAIMILQLRQSDETLMTDAKPTSAVEVLSGLTPTTSQTALIGLSTAPLLASPATDYQPLTDYFQGLTN